MTMMMISQSISQWSGHTEEGVCVCVCVRHGTHMGDMKKAKEEMMPVTGSMDSNVADIIVYSK